ncbi:ABC transporter substrate-binding protein [Spiroplasma turonicum]|uniref:Oligopeptide-binding protein SarA n=1 Tax=Spiroplasma turonicum TaxID=216946 RepID=A0A0K1P5T7_9MOLU|nr:ABC transporter substrate-binding protein [Spiroplasma turonicum]AKU79691.1 oligopeptide-binding protein SarA [Spiroplasma turonicum]ALX70711.1 oligopeptide ABC transporter substrate-binding protein [Spiroplasma turonicum]
MKKLLSSLMAVSFVVSSSASAYACGSKNQDPEKTIVAPIGTNVSKWLTSKTQNAEDGQILANTNANPLAADQYGRIYGDLFEPTNKNYTAETPFVGVANSDKTQWTYKVRDNATWSDYQGNKVDDLTADDFMNTARYALNPENASETINIWKDMIKGASELNTEAKKAGADFNQIFDSYVTEGKLGLKVEGSNVTFTLTKPAPYFESLLTYAVFSPIHKDALSDPSLVDDYKKGRYSGAFVPTSFTQDTSLILDKNLNYHFANKTNLNRLRYVFVGGGDSSKTRQLYEAGTISSYSPNPNDTAGWDEYVGDPNDPKKRDGMTKYTDSPDDASSWLMFYNYLNSDYDSTDSGKKVRARNASRLLQYKEARQFLTTGINRTDWATYYSNVYDEDKSVSSQLRNTYVPYNFVDNFLSYEKDALNEIKFDANKSTDSVESVTEDDLKDGVDFLRNSQYGKNKEGSDGFNQQVEKQVSALRTILEKDKFLGEILKSGKKIEIVAVKDPTSAESVGVYKDEMIKKFNALKNNPIVITQEKAISWNDYAEKLQSGKSDITFSSWSPDYKDPMTYSSTLKLDGDYELYLRQGNLFGFENFSDLDSSSADAAYKKLKEANKDKFNDVVVEQDGKSELFNSRYQYTKDLIDVDTKKTTDLVERNKEFAKLEVQTLYQDWFVAPFMRRSAAMSFTISHSTPFRLSRVAYGNSSYKLFNTDYVENLLTYDQIEELRTIYEKNKEEVIANPKTHQDEDIWNWSN